MSYRIESSVTILAPPEIVWTVIQDVDRRIEWDARVTAAKPLTPLPISKGTHIQTSMNMFGIPMHINMEMIVWKPPYRSAVRGTIAGLPDQVAGSWHFTPAADGATTWTTKIVITGQGRFGKLREQLNGWMTRRLTVISQHNLKRLIEAEYESIAVETNQLILPS